MSDRPSYAQVSPSERLHGIVADTSPTGDRGWIAPAIFRGVAGASIRTYGPREGKMGVRNRRGHFQSGANAPSVGRAAGSSRPTTGTYVSDDIDWSTRILSMQTPESPDYAPENLPWLGNRDAMDPAVAAAAQGEWERDTAALMAAGVDLQQERYCAETFFGTDLAGTGVAFDYADVSTAAAYNPAGLTFDDPEFDFVDFIARIRKALHLRIGTAAANNLTILTNEELASGLEANLGLLGIKVMGDPTAGVTSQMADRLSPDALSNRVRGLGGIGRMLRANAVYDNSLPTAASQNNAWVWPNALWIGLIGNAAPRAVSSGNGRLSTLDTSVLEIVHTPGKFGAKLNEDETLMKAWADRIIGYNVVNGSFGMAFANA